MVDLPISSTFFKTVEKLRRLAAKAALGNPLILPPLTPPAAWLASTAYVVGDIVTNGGNQYLCLVAGTSAASGGPSGLTSYISDNSVRWVTYNVSVVTAASPLAPVVGIPQSSLPSGLSATLASSGGGAYTVASATTVGVLRLYGCTWTGATVSGTAYGPVTFNNGATNALPYGRMAFMTDAAKLAIGFGNAGGYFRLLVDGQYVKLGNYKSGTSSNPNYVPIDFTAAGGKKVRKIEIEFGVAGALSVNLNIVGVYVSTLDTVWAPDTGDDITAVFISDSLDDGSASGPALAGNKQCARIAHLLGIKDMWSFSKGGTGETNKGVGSAFYTFGERVPQVGALNPSIIFIEGSPNDTANVSTTQAATLSTLQASRIQAPNALIVRVGVWPAATTANAAAIEAAVLAGFQQWADPRSAFIALATRADGRKLLTGTGSNTATANNGNQDFYIGPSDLIHPCEPGTELLADFVAWDFRQNVLPMAA